MGDYQNCSVLYCVLKFCTVISMLRWAILTVLWIGFCHTGPTSLSIDLFVWISCVFVSYCIVVLLWVRWCGPDGIEVQSLGPIFLQCFDTVGWVIWPFRPVPEMTYNVFGGTLNLAQTVSLNCITIDWCSARCTTMLRLIFEFRHVWFSNSTWSSSCAFEGLHDVCL